MEVSTNDNGPHYQPLISIIMATYNRAATLQRAIAGVLGQSYQNFELIIVDDGSTDDTSTLLAQYLDSRIRILKLEKNKGVTAAKNCGLNSIRGEWFTFLDSDDEMTPTALETFLYVVAADHRINAITCNCIDSVTGHFSGHGLDKDQFLDEERALNAKGEHWGLTRTSLLGADRFNEELPGFENTLWSKINSKATRYYLHKALRVYHTEGEDRISKKNSSTPVQEKTQQAKIFKALAGEGHYLRAMARFNHSAFTKTCIKGVVISMACKDRQTAQHYHKFLKSPAVHRSRTGTIIASIALLGGYPGASILYGGLHITKRLKKSLGSRAAMSS